MSSKARSVNEEAPRASASAGAEATQGLPSTGERFIPGLGGSIELEHLHRYLFARQACEGKAVLDIACGEGYGSAMLAQSARSVVGVDIANEAVVHARKHYGAPNLRFKIGSCAAIPLGEASVDVVVSFETIEHHDQHEEMMAEIARVLRPGGLLILSSPERFEYSERPGTHNEYHVHELYRDEFVELIQRHFTHSTLYDQKVLFGSAILSEELATRATSLHADALHERSRGLVRPLYLIAVASNGPLPLMDTGIFEQELAKTSEWKWWLDTVSERDTQIRALSSQNDEIRAALLRSTADVDQAAATALRTVELREEIGSVSSQRDASQKNHADAVAAIAGLQARIIETQDALAAQKLVLESAFDERVREMHHTFDLERAQLEASRLGAEQRRADDAASRIRELEQRFEAELAGQAAAHAIAERKLIDEAATRERDLEERSASSLQRLEEAAQAREEDLRLAHESRSTNDRAALAHLRQRVADLAADMARKSQQHDEVAVWGRSVDVALAERNAALAQRDALLVDRDRELAVITLRVGQLNDELQGLHHYAAKLQWVLGNTSHALDWSEQRVSALERALYGESATLQAIYRSTSWRISAPLRATKDALRWTKRLARRVAGHGMGSLRYAYRRVPLQASLKTTAKDSFFRTFGFALGRSGHYREWQSFHLTPAFVGPSERAMPFAETGEEAALSSPPPPLEVPLEVIPASVEPIPQLAEETTVMTEPVTLAPTYSAAGMPLWVADGTAEWSDLPILRERIAAVMSAQRDAVVPAPVRTFTVDVQDAGAAADALAFDRCDDPVVTILIPVYNHIALTLECLTSIATAKSAISYEILVADDASTDETAAILARIGNIKVQRNIRNLHFLRNCNAALPLVTGRYVVFLNNDVQVQDWWLDEMVALFGRHEQVGAVGPKIVYPSGHLQEAGCALNTDMTVDMIGINDDPGLPRYNYERRVDYCSGACLMVPTALITELGGFSEEFAPAYCEDGDLCLRIRELGMFVYYAPQATVVHRLSATTAAHGLDDKRRLIATNLARFAGKWQSRVEQDGDVRTIAFYLPQFYPFPENDRWWGKGFTEWTNVAKAQANFVGHYQPHLPADLGYYDLRVAQTMDEQAALARRYGLGGFCFYYYWFAGKRLLDLPVERMLETGKPDFPFCLCWANENWTRRWDGQETHVLMAQSHSDADDEAVIQDLIRYFRSPHYIRIDGRPLLVVYRVTLFPDFARTAAHWRSICRDAGIGEIYISMVESFELVASSFHPARYGCDSTIEFPPQGLAETTMPSGPLINADFIGNCIDYRTLALRYCSRPAPAYTRFRGAMPGWDNTPRRQNNSYCTEHATPGGFQAWLEHIVEDARHQHFGDERIVFINAWNEWAEGAHLEPDRRFGHTYLEAHANAKDRAALIRMNRYAFDG